VRRNYPGGFILVLVAAIYVARFVFQVLGGNLSVAKKKLTGAHVTKDEKEIAGVGMLALLLFIGSIAMLVAIPYCGLAARH
jgi:hypothetical protein